jgi:hypothetical protein
MFKKQSGRNRAAQASSPTAKIGTPPLTAAKIEAPPLPATIKVEPTRVEEGDFPATSSPKGKDRRPSREQVAIHAYHLWLARGKPVGTGREDWLEAERHLAASA